MTDHLVIVRDILQQLLALGPQKGARLKVILSREFERRTGKSFHEAFWNLQKFSAFLAANADLVGVEEPGGPGDITVRLLHGAHGQPPASPSLTTDFPARFLPPAVWNAFTNPDPRRRRFFHRSAGEVVHFVEGSTETPNPAISARVSRDPGFVEIVPASAEQQRTWLKTFLINTNVPESKRQVLETLAAVPYSSAINTAFVATLGDYAESWRQFRSTRVTEVVRSWAEERTIQFGSLLGEPAAPPKVSAAVMERRQSSEPRPATDEDMRRWLHEVVDSMESAELSLVLLPAGILRRAGVRRG